MTMHARSKTSSSVESAAAGLNSSIPAAVFYDRRVEIRWLCDLKRHPKARLLVSGRILPQAAQAIRRFGFLTPIIVDARNRIVDGLYHYEAAKRAGLKQVAVLRASRLTASERRRLRRSRKEADRVCAWYGRPNGFRSTAPAG